MSLPRCTATCAAALALTLLSPRSARAVSVDVGSFTKNSTTGNQTVNHSLGETPVALILWTASETNESFSSTFQFGMGLTDGTNSRSAAGSSQDNKSSSVTSRRLATKALTIVDYSQGTVAEADLSSWSSTSFTLNWTTNTASTGYVVHYLALGGYDVSSKVFTWVLNGSPTGNQSVTGVGFKPTSVLCLHAGPGFTSTPPNSSTHNTFGISVMDDQGNQWANTYLDTDTANPSTPFRYQRATKAIVILTTSGTLAKEANWVSMDSDGFTVNWTTLDTNASKAVCLALKGLRVCPGSFNKSTAAATATQTVTGVPFKPRAVLLASVQGVTSSSIGTVTRLGIGASNVTTNGSSAVLSTTASKSSVHSIDKTSKAFVKVDNNTPAIDAEATVTGFNVDGFTLSWTTNDSVATEILYLALAPKRRILVVE